VDHSGNVIDLAVLAVKVALIRKYDRSQDRILLFEKNGFYAESRKMQE
jgi:hypothetical protein